MNKTTKYSSKKPKIISEIEHQAYPIVQKENHSPSTFKLMQIDINQPMSPVLEESMIESIERTQGLEYVEGIDYGKHMQAIPILNIGQFKAQKNKFSFL